MSFIVLKLERKKGETTWQACDKNKSETRMAAGMVLTDFKMT